MDISLFYIIKNYFNAFFNQEFMFNQKNLRKIKSFQKIFVSKPEIKHLNSKAIVTVYTYNVQGRSIFNNVKRLILLKRGLILKVIFNILLIQQRNGLLKKYFLLDKVLNHLRRLKLKLNLNKYKFEDKLLYKLSKFISKYYNKKIEFNIVNLKSVMFNSDLFTEILTYKLKNRRSSPLRLMNIFLNKAPLPDVNRIKERSRVIKSVDYDLIGNKLKNLNLYSITGDNLENLLKDIYGTNMVTNTKDQAVYDTIFKSINYKNTCGVRLEVKGRLTKRYRADRAVYKLRWKGGLRNIDSSYKGLSSVNFRGFIVPNLQYSINTAKRRIGAFAVKGWVSGK